MASPTRVSPSAALNPAMETRSSPSASARAPSQTATRSFPVSESRSRGYEGTPPLPLAAPAAVAAVRKGEVKGCCCWFRVGLPPRAEDDEGRTEILAPYTPSQAFGRASRPPLYRCLCCLVKKASLKTSVLLHTMRMCDSCADLGADSRAKTGSFHGGRILSRAAADEAPSAPGILLRRLDAVVPIEEGSREPRPDGLGERPHIRLNTCGGQHTSWGNRKENRRVGRACIQSSWLAQKNIPNQKSSAAFPPLPSPPSDVSSSSCPAPNRW